MVVVRARDAPPTVSERFRQGARTTRAPPSTWYVLPPPSLAAAVQGHLQGPRRRGPGKRLAFIGDLLARNQMDSLLCLLPQAEMPTEVHTDAADRFGTWYFPGPDFTLTEMWTEYYAHAVPVAGTDGKPTSSFDIHLDRLGAEWTNQLLGLDYAVISGGNWFFRVNYLWEGGRRVGCVNCGRDANLTNFGVPYVVRRVVRVAVEGIAQCRDCKSVTTLLSYLSPSGGLLLLLPASLPFLSIRPPSAVHRHHARQPATRPRLLHSILNSRTDFN